MSIIPNNWHPSWDVFMTDETIEQLKQIECKIGESVKDYFPKDENVLRFLHTDLNNIKCIIVGMEPYPSFKEINGEIIPEATGRSFEITSVTDWNQKFKQSSLRNILKTIYLNKYDEKISLQEVRDRIFNETFPIKQPREWFNSLEEQGVLFLNATLTVKPSTVDTHTKYWDSFMTNLIIYIMKTNPNVKWMLWGDKAKNRVSPLVKEESVILSCHPRLAEFVDMNCFKYIESINWLG